MTSLPTSSSPAIAVPVTVAAGVPPLPVSTVPVVSVPTFLTPYREDEGLCTPDASGLLLDNDWITEDLLAEIDSLRPKTQHIDHDNDNCRDASAASAAMAKFFVVGRICGPISNWSNVRNA